MAVVVTVTIPETTTDQYDEVFKKTNPDGKAAVGGTFHVVAENGEGGLFMCDVWDSEEAFQKFMATQIGPAVAASGNTQTPEIKIMQVHQIVQS
jgi:heme-degrading monooxygenase HmoA